MSAEETYTIEQCINSMGLGKYQWRLITILGFCIMADAVEMMLLAILGPALTCYWPDVTQVQIASLTTAVFAGMMCGAMLFGIIADKYGRRKVILTSAILNTVFGIATGFAPSYIWVLIARTSVGFALAGASQGSTLMLEYLPSNTRATISIMIQIFWSIGSIFEYLTAMIVIPSYGWRLLTVLTALPITIIAIFMFFVPESPRYFVASGHPEKAEAILKQISMTNKRPLPSGTLHDVKAQDECGSIKQLFHTNYRRTSILLVFMWITVAMSYYGLILINTSLMTLDKDDHHETNLTHQNQTSINCKPLTNDHYKSLMLTTVGEMFGIPLLVLFLTHIGRRQICFINFFSASLCFVAFNFIRPNQTHLINIITFLARMFINSQFSLMYLYTMEVYPTVIRAMAVGCASSMARIGAMITPYLAQVLIKKTFHGTIAIYSIATLLAAIFALLLPIETRGRELKQATTDRQPSAASSDNSTDHPWLSAMDHLATFVNMNESVIDRGYRPLLQNEDDDEISVDENQ